MELVSRFVTLCHGLSRFMVILSRVTRAKMPYPMLHLQDRGLWTKKRSCHVYKELIIYYWRALGHALASAGGI